MGKNSTNIEPTEAQLEEIRYLRQYSLDMSKERYDTIKRAINLAFIINSGGLVSIPVFLNGDMSNLYTGIISLSVFLFISGIVHSFRSYWKLADGLDALSQLPHSTSEEEEQMHKEDANKRYKEAHDKCGGAVISFLIACINLIFSLPTIMLTQG